VAFAALAAFALMFFRRGKAAGHLKAIKVKAKEDLRRIKIKKMTLKHVALKIEEKKDEVEKEIEAIAKHPDTVHMSIRLAQVADDLRESVEHSKRRRREREG